MEKTTLPPKYYLDHFAEFTSFLKNKYQHLFQFEHTDFLQKFEDLSEDARCVYVRMSNRKGRVFHVGDLHYEEINDAMGAVTELIKNNFASAPTRTDLNEILNFLGKPELVHLLTSAKADFKKSCKKSELVELAKMKIEFSDLQTADFFNQLVVQNKNNELQYLSFLYFGEIRKNLAIYTLRDLGIREANGKKQEFKARFISKEEAYSHYFYAQLNEGDLADVPHASWPLVVDAHTKQLRGEALLSRASQAEADGQFVAALELFAAAHVHPARERQVRLLMKLEEKDLGLQVLNQIFEMPYSTEELIFAEDFLERKFKKKRTSCLTDVLRNAEEIWLDEAYYRKPENGALDHFRNQGFTAYHAENYLWSSLFGLLFWDELFESDQAAIFNAFERRSVTLIGSNFYEQNKLPIENTLAQLDRPEQAIKLVLKSMLKNQGVANQIFQWHPSTAEILVEFLKAADAKALVKVLRVLTQDYDMRRTGFPDIVTIKDGKVHFYEIKAEGDQLKSHQLNQLKLLKDSGFAVDLLKVKWAYNPQQVYVVVDVETTGGRADFHRLTEIGALKVQNGKVIDQFQTLINPGRPIPRHITQLTGITNEMVKDAPRFSEVAEKFEEFSKNAIFAAHFARFDYSFIQSEYRRLDINYVRPTFCTCAQTRKYFPGLDSYKLSSISKHFGISLTNHHRALCDAQAATEILFKIQQKRAQK
ncbi:MAG: VRR-NUC domain-containing protein [Bdellovibrio sp.]|nr:VRR-NUC domain-containing protein [Bdellovibrio sp.]